jgi:hypothetical protein
MCHGQIGAPYSVENLGVGTTFVRASYYLENCRAVLPAAKNDRSAMPRPEMLKYKT